MATENKSYVETIEFRAVAPASATNLKGLDEAITKLNALNSVWQSLQARVAGMNQPLVFKKQTADITEAIRAAEKLGRFGLGVGGSKNPASLKVADMAKALGYGDGKAMHEWLVQGLVGGKSKAAKEMRELIKESYNAAEMEFRSLTGASKGISAYTKHFHPNLDPQGAIRMIFNPNNPTQTQAAAAPTPVVPPVPGQAGAYVKRTPVARPANDPTVKAEDEAEAEEAAKFRDTLAAIKRELAEKLIQRPGDGKDANGESGHERVSAAREYAAKQVRGLVGDNSAPGSGKKYDDAMAWAANQQRQAVEANQRIMTDYGAQLATVRKTLAAANERADKAQIELLKQQERDAEKAEAQAKRNLARAAAAEAKAQAAQERSSKAADKQQQRAAAQAQRAAEKAERQAQQNTVRVTEAEKQAQAQKERAMRQLDRAIYKPGEANKAEREKRAQQAAEAEHKRTENVAYREATYTGANSALNDFLGSGGKIISQTRAYKGAPASIVARKQEDGMQHTLTVNYGAMEASASLSTKAAASTRKLADEMGVLSGNFVTNTLKVTAWAASVGVLYKSMALAEHSMEQVIAIGAQMGRLEQVFHGVGGSAEDLASDVLHLAAMTGRSDEEAIESAIRWSRMGLTRVQVNEAVRLSLIAANVAQLTANEATEHLTAIMQNYGLSVGQLASVLGELNQTANSYNVTNADMLQGIARTSAAAKQAGLPLQELIGVLGATVGATGQTGANIGNAVKSVTLALSNPELQKKLRLQFGFEVTQGGESLQPMNMMLGQLYTRYQKLNDAERQSMLFSIAGKTQASRLAAIMDNYVRSQVLAINAQLNLNSAEVENQKIVNSLKRQFEGLSTEWERFVFIQGSHGPTLALIEFSKALRNLLAIMNTPVGGGLTTAMMGLFAVAGARTLMTGMFVKDAAKKGYVGRTMGKAGEQALELSGWMNSVVGNYTGNNAARQSRYNRYKAMRQQGMSALDISMAGGVNPSTYSVFRSGLGGAMTSLNDFGNTRANAGWKGMSGGVDKAAKAMGLLNLATGATSKALAVALITLEEFLVPLLVIVGLVMAFNKGMELLGLSSEKAEKKLAGFNEEMERAHAGAAAFGEAARLMQTAQNALSPNKGVMNANAAKTLIAQISEVAYADEPDLKARAKKQAAFQEELQTMQAQNNQAGIRALLDERVSGLLSSRLSRIREEQRELQKTNTFRAQEIQKLEGYQKGWRAYYGSDDRQKQIDQLKKEQMEGISKGVGMTEEAQQANEEYWTNRFQYDERHQGALEAEKQTLTAIADLYNQIKTTNSYEKNRVTYFSAEAQKKSAEAQISGLDAQDQASFAADSAIKRRLSMLNDALIPQQAAVDQLEEKGKTLNILPIDQGPGAQAWRAQLKKATSDRDDTLQQIDTLNNGRDPEFGDEPRYMVSRARQREALQEQLMRSKSAMAAAEATKGLAENQEAFQYGQERADRNAAGADYGVDPTAKLLEQRKYLTQDIANVEQQINLDSAKGLDVMAEKGQQLQDINLLERDTLSILQRQQEVERDIKQLTIDQNKEFMRSFYGAGSGEMLQKLAAFRMAFNDNGTKRPGMSQGAFFAMSPEMRKNYGELNPEFNPQMRELKNEQTRITDAIVQMFGSMKPTDIDAGLRSISDALANAAAGIQQMLPQAALTAAASITKAGDSVAEALDGVADKIKAALVGGGGTTRGGQTPANAQSGGLGGSVGFVAGMIGVGAARM